MLGAVRGQVNESRGRNPMPLRKAQNSEAAGVRKARTKKDLHSVFEALRASCQLTISSDLALLQYCSLHVCSGQCP